MAKSRKIRYGPELDQFIKKEKIRRYATYHKATVLYSISYYALVKLAKEADACWKIRKTALVDLDKLDEYLENFKDGEVEE